MLSANPILSSSFPPPLQVAATNEYRTRTSNVSYEPSYHAFERKGNQDTPEKQASTAGRKTFGTFFPDIDVCVREVTVLIELRSY